MSDVKFKAVMWNDWWSDDANPSAQRVTVELVEKCYGFGHLINKNITIDGAMYHCSGVLNFGNPPFLPNQLLDLIVEEVPA